MEFTGRLTVKVSPQAQETSFEGWFFHQFRPVLKIRVKAIPEKGAANAALCKFLAKTFGTSASQIRLISGERSKIKVFALLDVSREAWELFLDQTKFSAIGNSEAIVTRY
ncbi:MAG: DUF167 domain-containing protein [Alphaproteobacteria bacterium]